MEQIHKAEEKKMRKCLMKIRIKDRHYIFKDISKVQRLILKIFFRTFVKRNAEALRKANGEKCQQEREHNRFYKRITEIKVGEHEFQFQGIKNGI